MRKLSLLFVFAALSLATTASFAQEVKEVKEEVKEVATKMVQDKVEVQLTELPEAVTKALAEQFAEFTPEKAYKASKDGAEVYHVKLQKEGKYIVATLDAEGNVLKQKDAEIK